MNIQRARQILRSDETFTVLYNGSPIWIESLNSKGNSAMIRPMDGREGAREVPVTELVEV
jgi:small acid-soluble spore protein H (minor)